MIFESIYALVDTDETVDISKITVKNTLVELGLAQDHAVMRYAILSRMV